MRIVALNIRHGGGRRGGRIAEALSAEAPDVVVLSEFRAGATAELLLASLARSGLRQVAQGERRPVADSVAIVSRDPLEAVTWPIADPTYGHRFVEATVNGLRVGAVYLPLGHGPTAAWWQLFGPIAAARIAEPYIFLGDWNVGLAGPDHDGPALPGWRDLAALHAAGWTDAWRHLHPGGREFSWYHHVGTGFRIDHALLSPALMPRLAGAEFAHGPRLSRASDHSALVIDLNDQATAG